MTDLLVVTETVACRCPDDHVDSTCQLHGEDQPEWVREFYATRWRDHPRYEGYQVSNDGRVRSIDRMVPNRWGGQHLARGRELATFIRKGGYLGGNLSHEGHRINFEVHVLVAEAWHGERPDTMHVRHIDGNKLNNNPANLAWGTISANMLDKVTHGTHHEAIKTHCPLGHEYTDDNTYRAPSSPNRRHCRTCMQRREAQRPPRPHRKAR